MTDVHAAWWVGDILAQEQSGKVFAVTAGFSSGKTHGAGQWHDYLARGPNKKAEFSGWMEPTYQLIKTAALPTYRRVLESYGVQSGRDYEIFESSPIRLRYRRTGHTVLFVSGD